MRGYDVAGLVLSLSHSLLVPYVPLVRLVYYLSAYIQRTNHARTSDLE